MSAPAQSAADYRTLRLSTGRGEVVCRYYPAEGATRAAVWVGGVGGGWDSPARGLYPRLCAELAEEGIAGLRVQYRRPSVLEEATHDVLAGIDFLRGEGVAALALGGHSLGGAVVIRAAFEAEPVRTVVALAPQAYGAEPVAHLGPRCSALFVHGTEDRILPPICSEHLHALAREPKRLVLLPGAGHVLDEAADEVDRLARAWVREQLAG